MAWSAPHTWSVGDLLTAAQMNAVSSDLTALRTSIDYVQITSTVNVTATTEGTAVTVVTGTTLTYDTAPVYVEFFAPDAGVSTGAAGAMKIVLLRGSTVLGQSTVMITSATDSGAINVSFRDASPPGGSYAYVVKAFTPNQPNTIICGAGGSGNALPAFLRVSSAATT